MPRDLPPTTREGALLRKARQRLSPKVSIATAAKRAGVSAENWGHVERGYQSMGRNQAPRIVIPPADTLAHMAHAVSVSPDELLDIDRPDAAELLSDILGRRPAGVRTLERPLQAENTRTAAPARWLAAEMERRGQSLDAVLSAVTTLKEVAGHFNYSLAELLLDSGLVDPTELVIRPRTAPAHDDLEAFRRQAERIAKDPHLSPGQRKDAERLARQILADLERRQGTGS